MKTKKFLSLLLSALLLLSVWVGGTTVSAEDYEGPTSANPNNEAELLAALANPHISVIEIYRDITLTDKVQISRPVRIYADAHNSLNKGIEITGDNVFIRGLKIIPSKFYTDSSGDKYFGIVIDNASNVYLESISITGPAGIDWIGISDKSGNQSTSFTVRESAFRDGMTGIRVESPNTHANIKGNSFRNFNHGVNLEYATISNIELCCNNFFAPKTLSDGVTPGDGITLPEGSDPAIVGFYKENNRFEEGFTATNDIVVVGGALPPVLLGIGIASLPAKTTYVVGEALDLTGLVVEGIYNDSSRKTETVTATDVSGFNSTVPVKNQTLTITIGGKKAYFTVDIIEEPDYALTTAKAAAATRAKADFTSSSWTALDAALKLPEGTSAEKSAKAEAINNAISALVMKPLISTGITAKTNVILIGDYAFDLKNRATVYNLNNFMTASKTVYTTQNGTEVINHVYYKDKGKWYDLVTDPDLEHAITDLSTLNGNGRFQYLDMVDQAD